VATCTSRVRVQAVVWEGRHTKFRQMSRRAAEGDQRRAQCNYKLHIRAWQCAWPDAWLSLSKAMSARRWAAVPQTAAIVHTWQACSSRSKQPPFMCLQRGRLVHSKFRQCAVSWACNGKNKPTAIAGDWLDHTQAKHAPKALADALCEPVSNPPRDCTTVSAYHWVVLILSLSIPSQALSKRTLCWDDTGSKSVVVTHQVVPERPFRLTNRGVPLRQTAQHGRPVIRPHIRIISDHTRRLELKIAYHRASGLLAQAAPQSGSATCLLQCTGVVCGTCCVDMIMPATTRTTTHLKDIRQSIRLTLHSDYQHAALMLLQPASTSSHSRPPSVSTEGIGMQAGLPANLHS